MAKQFDLVVLGSGGAGYRAAVPCATAGWKVALIDNNNVLGGTCDNRGCIPKKVLVGAAEVADLNRRFHELGIVTSKPEMNWTELIRFKRTFTDPISDETVEGLKKAGVEVYVGQPKFVNKTTIEVNGEQLSSEYFHIAVGAKPMKLAFEGAEHLMTSDQFLEMEHLPASIVLVGAGYISFEFAHMAARFGASVTILHENDQPLPAFDPDAVKTLLAASHEVGIEVILNAAVQKVEKTEHGYTVHAANGQQYTAELAVHGAGRVAAIDELNLEAADVQYERRGVVVNEYLQSVSNPKVYAGGDSAADGPPLSPVARLHGRVVANNLLGQKTKQPSYRSTPSVVFTTPPLARVGLLESEAKEQGLDVRVHTEDMSGWVDARRTNLKHTMSKVLIENGSNKIVGAHLIGNHAEDLINMFALAIENDLTVEQFQTPIYAFPTASDDARFML